MGAVRDLYRALERPLVRMNAYSHLATQIHVAVAVLTNDRGEVLVSLRSAQAHQGGLWEFPGGKLEPGEAPYAALKREVHEELDITVQAARPLIRVPHRYPDKHVLLDVWRVTAFAGTARGREGQPIAWVAPAELHADNFPAANTPILAAARLPDRYLITPEPGADFLSQLERALADGIKLVQLRAKSLDRRAYVDLAQTVCARAGAAGAQVLLNADPARVAEIGADGVHLTSQRLMALSRRPLGASLWVAASCHSHAELAHAARIGCDFAVLGPVRPTQSHPGAPYLDWAGLHALTEDATLPVYALGGLRAGDLAFAWDAGAQGIAAIRGLWPESL